MSVYAITLAMLGTAAEVLLLGILLRRGATRQVPTFIAYVYWLILSDIAMYAALRMSIYTRVYSVEVVCDGAVLFVVLVDLARSVLRPLPKNASRSIVSLLVLIVAGAAPIIWRFSDSWSNDGWPPAWHSLMRLLMTLALLRILFLVLLGGLIQFLVSHFVRVGWGERELQMATGIGIYALASLAGSLLLTHHWSALVTVGIGEGESTIFFVVLVYWIFVFSRPAGAAAGLKPEGEPSTEGSGPLTLWMQDSPVTKEGYRADKF